jgi:DHA1 family L-arabinose/isopropyl-beta-D-thiogalactopyranoside export protein-like MFS transporter/DHA1 family inner membrane transport protein
VAALSMSAFALVTAELLPIGLLTLVAADLGRSRSQVGLLVSGYAVVVVLASLPLTAVTRRVPRRRLLTLTLIVFAAGNALSAIAPGYQVLAVARLITALTHALFWSLVTPTVGGLFPAGVRGRVLGVFAAGPALAPLLGVPLGTWLGQQFGWRSAFLAAAVAGLVVTVAVGTLLPSVAPAEGGAERGTAPHRRRFALLVVATAVGVCGFLTFQTYVTPFLLDVSGFAAASLAPLLFVAGAAGIGGALAVGRTLDAHPVSSLLVPLGVGGGSLVALFALGTHRPATLLLLAGAGLAYSAFATALQHRTLTLAPGSTDLASAGMGTAFNAGSFLGGLLLPATGARPLALAGGVLVLVAAGLLAAPA